MLPAAISSPGVADRSWPPRRSASIAVIDGVLPIAAASVVRSPGVGWETGQGPGMDLRPTGRGGA